MGKTSITSKKKFGITLLIVAILCLVFIVLYTPITAHFASQNSEPLFEDENATTIDIDRTIPYGYITMHLDRLEVGDNYSVLYFDNPELSSIPPLRGAKLYQNGTLLAYIDDASSTGSISAIAFAPAGTADGLELRIDVIVDKITIETLHPLEFAGNVASVQIDIDDTQGTVTITLTDDGYQIATTSLAEYEVQKEFRGSSPNQYILMIDDVDITDTCTIANPPTHLKIIMDKIVYEGETIVIPIS